MEGWAGMRGKKKLVVLNSTDCDPLFKHLWSLCFPFTLSWIIDWAHGSLESRSGASRNQRQQAGGTSWLLRRGGVSMSEGGQREHQEEGVANFVRRETISWTHLWLLISAAITVYFSLTFWKQTRMVKFRGAKKESFMSPAILRSSFISPRGLSGLALTRLWGKLGVIYYPELPHQNQSSCLLQLGESLSSESERAAPA